MGCYLDLENASSMERVVGAIGQHHRGTTLLMEGNFNTNLVEPYGNTREKSISAVVPMEVLEEMYGHFLL